MKIPVTLKVKETKTGKRFTLSYLNNKGEWVTSIFSQERQSKNNNRYWNSLIDTEQEAWKPTPKVEEDVDPEEYFKDMVAKEEKQEVIFDEDLPF